MPIATYLLMLRPAVKMLDTLFFGDLQAETYNEIMASQVIEGLIKAAKSSTDNDSSINVAKKQFTEADDAIQLFRDVRRRMLLITEWRKNSSVTGYDLFDEDGELINSEPINVGHFIRLSLYGTGKYDWVRVIKITDEPEEFIITVKPSFDPIEAPRDPARISHFFRPEATNNFCLQIDDKTVAFYIIGLNEKTNTDFVDGLIESARNTGVANIGYYSGLQKAIWKEFCKKMLESEEKAEAR